MDVAAPIDYFSTTFSLLRKGTGSYDSGGNWVEASPTFTNIAASIQPVTGRDLMDAPEGVRTEAEYKLWSRVPILLDDNIIEPGGDQFRVCHTRPRRTLSFFTRALLGKLGETDRTTYVMPSAAFNKFNSFVENLAGQVFDLTTGTTHVYKFYLTNATPSASLDSVKADLAEITAENGYTAGGVSIGTITGAQTSGVFKFSGATDVEITASGGSFGPFQYAVLYDDTATNDELIGWYDYGSPLTVLDGKLFRIDHDQTNGLFTIT